MLVAILALVFLIPLAGMINTAISSGINTTAGKDALAMSYHISGEFAIR